MQNLVCFPLAYSNTLPAERIRLLWSGFFPPFPFGKWGKVVLGGQDAEVWPDIGRGRREDTTGRSALSKSGILKAPSVAAAIY
jgi:hypothetical protein